MEDRIVKVLCLQDDPFVGIRLQNALEDHSHEIDFHLTFVDTLEGFQQEVLQGGNEYQIVIIDFFLNEAETLNTQFESTFEKMTPRPALLVISAAVDVDSLRRSALEKVQDFIPKSLEDEEIVLLVQKNLKVHHSLRRSTQEEYDLTHNSEDRYAGDTLRHIDHSMDSIVKSAIRTVHVFGETGTGKEVVSDIIQSKLQPHQPFIRVNCGALSPQLAESELLGHVKGAFTGADEAKKGLLEQADGGWIFLDEVGTLSLKMQQSLLRVVENQQLRRLGSSREKAIDVKVLSATNVSIENLVKQKRFRQDLWMRLCEKEIYLPPLRERLGEIPEIVTKLCMSMEGGPYTTTQPTLNLLLNHPWENGNVRELRNCLRAMTEHAQETRILTPMSIPERIIQKVDALTKQSEGFLRDTGRTDTEFVLPDVNLQPPQSEAGQLRKTHTKPESAQVHWHASLNSTAALRLKILGQALTKEELNYTQCCDYLLLDHLHRVFEEHRRASIRKTSELLEVSRTKLQAALERLPVENLDLEDRFREWVLGLRKKSDSPLS